MACSTILQFGTQNFLQYDPKVTKELGIPIRNNGPGNAMQPCHLLEVQLGNVLGIISFAAWDKMCHLKKPIHYNRD